MWTLPAWAFGVLGLYLAFGVDPRQPPPPPMVSGPLLGGLAVAVLLLDWRRFFRVKTKKSGRWRRRDGAIIGSFFLGPTAEALGRSGRPFMDHLMNRRRMGIFFPIVAALTVLSGAALYWRDSGGLQAAWIASPSGLAFTIGGVAAIGSFIGGLVLVGPSVAEQTAVQNELASGDDVPTEGQRRRLERADGLMRLATRSDLPLILLAGLTMAVGRYL